jgi:hypothetical protein
MALSPLDFRYRQLHLAELHEPWNKRAVVTEIPGQAGDAVFTCVLGKPTFELLETGGASTPNGSIKVPKGARD